MTVETKKLSPLGVEIYVDSLRHLSDSDLRLLKQSIAQQGLAVIREQAIDDREFVDFLGRLGPITFTTGEPPVPAQPLLNVVSNVGRKTPPRSVFHTDTSYVRNPPAYTALRPVTLPAGGGETLFTDQYSAYEALPAWVKRHLQSAKVLHVASGVELAESDESRCWHPLFRRHPISERIALFLSTPKRCQQISGFSPETGARIIKCLYRRSIRKHPVYRHRWRDGDIVIWDNRCTLHRADHSGVRGDRVLHRGLVLGEVPIAA